uniref:Inner membrane protein CreD n=1 Tax=Aliivibrio wodanis TaxID=80852 RepID=A0A5Q4ZXK7_9GAMM|nr:Inner membrane protein CreD [Aliivibrio wodanis]
MKNILNNQLGMKFGFVLFLFLLLQIPLSMVEDLISERTDRQQEVLADIARSSSNQQQIIGPFIKIDYTEIVNNTEKTYIAQREAFLLPDLFSLTSHLDSFEKYRGIYKAHLYNAKTALTGQFTLSALDKLNKENISKISLVVAISDSRGLIDFNAISINGNPVNIQPGTGVDQYAEGFHHTLDIKTTNFSKPLTFDFNFLLQGMGKLQVLPIGQKTTVVLSSSWPHPSFIGNYLPISSTITDSGFSAQWNTNNFSSNINQLFERCLSMQSKCKQLEEKHMGVNLIEPVDHYLKSHRSINYSLLVITLIFACFFLLELFQARPIHPVQYGFVGLALALFYLLLISFSEHIGFNWAYIFSTIASTGLLCLYVGGMLNNKKHGAIFGVSLLTLYGLLFGLLQADSYALLMGTLLCFIVLSLVMIFTRHINWYERSANINITAESPSDIKETHDE